MNKPIPIATSLHLITTILLAIPEDHGVSPRVHIDISDWSSRDVDRIRKEMKDDGHTEDEMQAVLPGLRYRVSWNSRPYNSKLSSTFCESLDDAAETLLMEIIKYAKRTSIEKELESDRVKSAVRAVEERLSKFL